jgi:DnaK suppressor protein
MRPRRARRGPRIARGVKFNMATPLHEQCRATLQAERAELQHNIETLSFDDLRDREVVDPADVVDLLNRTLNEIDNALARLSNGTFGLCELCKAIISAEWLAENPAARHCVDCADAETSVITADRDVE